MASCSIAYERDVLVVKTQNKVELTVSIQNIHFAGYLLTQEIQKNN